MEDRALIEDSISRATGEAFSIESMRAIGGGCINDAFCIAGRGQRFFVKANRTSFLESFERESDALQEIAGARALRVPKPVGAFASAEQAYLVLEFIETRPSRSGDWKALGEGLARLHAKPQPHFGWMRDNFIGSTPQPNPWSDHWIDFFRVHRLEGMMRLCRNKGFQLHRGQQLLEGIERFFDAYDPHPSLLHGDLWSGNIAFTTDGEPFLVDPASYYGDRECDLAFTEFFGGFAPAFYEAYQSVLPQYPGHEERKTLYNLYHCLNHVYIFGSSYIQQAQAMIDQLLRR